jgi:hypothetical protein
MDTKDTRTRAQERFLRCYEEAGQVLGASRLAKVARSTHYRWLEEDPTYQPRFQTARIKAAQRLEDEAVRVAQYGMRKLVLYHGEPVRIEGELLYEHEYSDRLMARLLKAGDPGRFNSNREAPMELDLDNLTEGQIRDLLAWIRLQKVAKGLRGQKPKQPAEPTVEATPVSEPAKQAVATAEIIPPYRGDGWPYKVGKKRER